MLLIRTLNYRRHVGSGIVTRLLSLHQRSFNEQAQTVCSGSGSAVQTKESGHSGARGAPTTSLAITADAVNQKVDVAFGRGCDGRLPSQERQIIGRSGLPSRLLHMTGFRRLPVKSPFSVWADRAACLLRGLDRGSRRKPLICT